MHIVEIILIFDYGCLNKWLAFVTPWPIFYYWGIFSSIFRLFNLVWKFHINSLTRLHFTFLRSISLKSWWNLLPCSSLRAATIEIIIIKCVSFLTFIFLKSLLPKKFFTTSLKDFHTSNSIWQSLSSLFINFLISGWVKFVSSCL